MKSLSLPTIIQGGMGAGISDWRLARAVSVAGGLGVVSGVALDLILARRLQLGDEGGDMRRALEQFPFPEIAKRIIDRYYVEGGIPQGQPFKAKHSMHGATALLAIELLVAANFVETYLAKEGHNAPVGINYLEKIQYPLLASIYGSMLAGVDNIIVGAGIPRTIPGILDSLAKNEPVELLLDVQGAEREDTFMSRFDPKDICGDVKPEIKRPNFLAIVSSSALAKMLIKKSNGSIEGFIVENHTAGGHNAPPRGRMQLTDIGEPIYGERDNPNLEEIKAMGLPFWVAGSYAEPELLAEALALGASGVQVGTAFAFSEESGLVAKYKAEVLKKSINGNVEVFTSPVASPTGFPFKVVSIEGTISEEKEYKERTRLCDLAYLCHAYKKEDGALGWRCPAEPIDTYLKKGGLREDTVGRVCVCNGLMSDIGLAQTRNGEAEKVFVTSGDDVVSVARFLPEGKDTYTAEDVLKYLLKN